MRYNIKDCDNSTLFDNATLEQVTYYFGIDEVITTTYDLVEVLEKMYDGMKAPTVEEVVEDIDIVMQDVRNLEDAKKHIERGAIVFDFSEYVKEWGEAVEGDGLSIVEFSGKKYVIQYCL